MFIGIGKSLPQIADLPGPSRPGHPSDGYSYGFQFKLEPTAENLDFTFRAGRSLNLFYDSVIDWGDGTEENITGQGGPIQFSHTYTSGGTYIVTINKEVTSLPIDIFQNIDTGSNLVTEVISWGDNSWYKIPYFYGSTGLKKLPDSGSRLIKADNSPNSFFSSGFNQCLELEEVDASNWDMVTTTGDTFYYTFFKCAKIAKIKWPKAAKPVAMNYTFSQVGTAVTSGCKFEMEGVDWSSGSGSQWSGLFSGALINEESDFSNWVFPSTYISNTSNWFYGAKMAGSLTNPILKMSGWTTFQGGSFLNFFSGFGGYRQAIKPIIDTTGLNTSSVTRYDSMFYYSSIHSIKGLNDWTSSTSVFTIAAMFVGATSLRFPAGDPNYNFSDSFGINLLNATNTNNTFAYVGSTIILDGEPSSEIGDPPNITNWNLSSGGSMASWLHGCYFNSIPDFSTMSFPTATVAYNNFMNGVNIIGTVDKLVLNNANGARPSSMQQAFSSARINEYEFPDTWDFSNTTSFSNTFYYAGEQPTDTAVPSWRNIRVEFPTNLDFGNVTTALNMFVGQDSSITNETPFVNGQANNFIRAWRDTRATGAALNVKIGDSMITEAPSLVRADLDYLVNTLGWTVTVSATDSPMPFTYPVYDVDPSVYPTLNATIVTSGGTFTATGDLNNHINSSTGSIDASGATAGTYTVRYTLIDGYYVEVEIIIQ